MLDFTQMNNLEVFMRYFSLKRSDIEGIIKNGFEGNEYYHVFREITDSLSPQPIQSFEDLRGVKVPFEFGIIPFNLSLTYRTLNGIDVGINMNNETYYAFDNFAFYTRNSNSPHTYYDVHGFDGIPDMSVNEFNGRLYNIVQFLSEVCHYSTLVPGSDVVIDELSYIVNGSILYQDSQGVNHYAQNNKYCSDGNTNLIRLLSGVYHILGGRPVGSNYYGNSPTCCAIGVKPRNLVFGANSFSTAELNEISAILGDALTNYDFNSSSFIGTVYNKTENKHELVCGERGYFRANYLIFDSKFFNIEGGDSREPFFVNCFNNDFENGFYRYHSVNSASIDIDAFFDDINLQNQTNRFKATLPSYRAIIPGNPNGFTSMFNSDPMLVEDDFQATNGLGHSTYVGLIGEANTVDWEYGISENPQSIYGSVTRDEGNIVDDNLAQGGIPTYEFLPMYYVSLDDCVNVGLFVDFIIRYMNYNETYSDGSHPTNFNKLISYNSTFVSSSGYKGEVLSNNTFYNNLSYVYCKDTDCTKNTTSEYVNIKGLYEISTMKDNIAYLADFKKLTKINGSYNYYLVFCNFNVYLVPKSMMQKYVWDASYITPKNLIENGMVKKYCKVFAGGTKEFSDGTFVYDSPSYDSVPYGYTRVGMPH